MQDDEVEALAQVLPGQPVERRLDEAQVAEPGTGGQVTSVGDVPGLKSTATNSPAGLAAASSRLPSPWPQPSSQ